MAKKKGICHICGKGTRLTDEHTPARMSGNIRPAIRLPITRILEDGRIDFRNQKPDPKGLYYRTLCEDCNNLTGNKYVSSFSDFCINGLTALQRRISKSKVIPVIEIYPLRIIKQVFSIFCVISSEDWIDTIPGSKEYILDHLRTTLDYDFSLTMYFLKGSIGRTVGGSLVGDAKNQHHHAAEFSFPPFGFVLTKQKYFPDKRLKDITYFRTFGYNDRTEFFLDMHRLPNNSLLPLTFDQEDPKYNFRLIGANIDMHEQLQSR